MSVDLNTAVGVHSAPFECFPRKAAELLLFCRFGLPLDKSNRNQERPREQVATIYLWYTCEGRLRHQQDYGLDQPFFPTASPPKMRREDKTGKGKGTLLFLFKRVRVAAPS